MGNASNTTATLPLMLKQLKLAAMRQQWEALGDKALKAHWTPQEYVAELCRLELDSRHDKRLKRYLEQAQLPVGKHFDNYDFSATDGVSQAQVYDLIERPQWLQTGDNLLFLGASGLGKTHLVSSIGYGLLEQGHRVHYTTAVALIQQLQHAKQTLRLENELKKLDKYALLIIDDVGYVRKSELETSVLFELIAHRYERYSIAITSNKPFDQWDDLFDDSTMTVAAIDRLVHHATIIHCQGESYRRKHALARQSAAGKTGQVN